jgi:tol-pal system protein YbgF
MTRSPATRSRRAKARAIASPRTLSAREAMLALLAGFALLAAALMAAPSASGQVFSSTPYTAAPDPAVEQLRKRVEELEADLKRATDRSEKLAFDLSQARKVADEANAGRLKAEAQLISLSDRITDLEERAGIVRNDGASLSGSGSGPVPAGAPGDAAVNLNASAGQGLANRVEASALPQDEESLLKEARNLLLDGNYPSAQQGFTSYLAKFSKSPSAHEAQYLLGESLLYQDNYTQAADAYGKLLSAYPKSPNGPNALVKLARSLRLLNKKGDACKALALMPQQFPKASDAAKQLASTERQRSNCK